MEHRLVISARLWEALLSHLLSDEAEHIAFILAGYGGSRGNQMLVARELLTIPDEDLEPAKHLVGLSLRLEALLDVMNRANREGLALVEAHSHPLARDYVTFSEVDEEGQREIAGYLEDTLPGRPFGALVVGHNAVDGCIWNPGSGSPLQLAEVRVLGEQVIRLPTSRSSGLGNRRDDVANETRENRFHRQILAIGETGQRKVRETKPAIVGLGGIGSVVAQQLAHLGVQRFTLIDDDSVDRTNLHRLVGSTPADVGELKVEAASRLIRTTNPSAEVEAVAANVRTEGAIEAVKTADILIGCVDTDAGRLILNELALAYLVPYIDCGVGIRAGENGLDEAGGKVSVWTPGRPCLLCTKDVSPRIAAEELESEEERRFRQQHGYVVGADIPEPAVISLNSTIASLAVTEFLALVTGLRPTRHYTYYDMLEQRAGPRVVERDDRCTACSIEGLGDVAHLERYSHVGLPDDLPQV